jgi:hypothetical protein
MSSGFIPPVSIPKVPVPNILGTEINIPGPSNIQIPNLPVPNVQIPEINIPNVQIPDISVPEINIPNISEFPIPNVFPVRKFIHGWRKPTLDDIKKYSPFHPIKTFKITGIYSTINRIDLREFMPPVYDQHDIGSCHDDQTEVLTENGWKLFKDVSENGEKLATVNPKTSELFYEQPSNLLKLPYNGKMVVGKNQNTIDFRVTPNHKMLLRKWNESARTLNHNYEFIDADDIGWYAGLMNRVEWNGTDKASDVYIIPYVEHKHKNKDEQRKDKIIDMGTWLKFLGIYLAEGTMANLYENLHYKIQIAAVKEREKTFIKELFNNMGIHYLELKDRFTFDNKQIYEELTNLGLKGVKAPQKFVPKFVFDQKAEHIKEFLLGHFSGDGCDQKGQRSQSSQLANDLQLLIFLSGDESGFSTLVARRSVMKDGRIVQGNYPEHRVSVRENKNLSINRKDNISYEHYEGYVYCAEVPTYHTLVTRRNRKILISGNCTANAIGAAYEFSEIKQNEKNEFIPSRLFLYYFERLVEGSVLQDAGAQLYDGISVIKRLGICPEVSPEGSNIPENVCWPYDTKKFAQKPPMECIFFARKHRAIEAVRVQQTLSQLKQCLIEGYPICFGFMVFPSFMGEDIAKDGLMHMPQPGEQMVGGHAVLIAGIDTEKQVYDQKGAFLVRNSWGPGWGEGGYFWMPIKYVLDLNLCADFWVVTKIE